MRIIGGKARGRHLKTPTGSDIRPTSDKVRLAVFNALFSRGGVAGQVVLDAFCGTGALGLEALSQGAEKCYFFDKSQTSLALAKENALALEFEKESVFILKDITKVGMRPAEIPAAQIVFLDPPYRQDLIPKAFKALTDGQWIADGAIIITEMEGEGKISSSYLLEFDKKYGDTRVCFFRYQI